MSEEPIKYWRYDDAMYDDEKTEPHLASFLLVRCTQKGVFLKVYGQEKFQLNGVDGKRFAYPTVELALKSYIRRKKRAIGLLTAQLDKQTRMLHFAETGKMPSKEFTLDSY